MRTLLCGASLAAVLACAPFSARAEDRYWDANGTAVGSGGSGTWNLANLNWSPNGDGVSGPFVEPWANGDLDNAIFGGTAGTVTVGVPVTVGNITFSSAGYVLNGSTITLGGATPTITTGGNAAINSVLAGNAGLTKAGAGVLSLTGANSFSGGINVTAGQLNVSGDSALGAAGNGIALSSGTILHSAGALNSSRVITLLSGSSGIGGGVGSAHITGAGGFTLVAQTSFTDNTNDFTGPVGTDGFNLYFTSIGNLGEASALGAANTVANGTIFVRNAAAVYTGSGATSNRSWSMAPQTGASILRNQGSGLLTVTGDINAGGGYTSSVILDALTADMALSGVITSNLAARPFIFTGGGTNRTITLGNANTFGGTATIQNVTVRANSLADQGVASSLGTGGTIAINSGALSYTGTGSSTDRTLFLNGASSVLNDGTGALNLAGGVVFNPANPGDSLILGGSFAGSNTLSGAISGNGGLVMNGAGSWLLGGANSFTGSTTVNSGTLLAGSDLALGAANALIVNGGTLDLNTHDLTVTSLNGTGGSVALTGGNLTVNGATSSNYSGVLTGIGGLVKRGTGTLALSGQSSYSGDTTINGGGLSLNFAAAGAPVSNIVSNQSTLNMAGGTLTLTGAGVANSQTFDGLNVAAGNNRIVMASGAGGSMALNLGALTRSGGLLDFTLPVNGTITTTNGDGALGWATINGTDYAQVSGGLVTAFTAYAQKDNASTWLTGDVVSDEGGAANTGFFNSVTGDVQLGGVKYTAAANSTVTVGGANTLGVDGTIIVASSINNGSQLITGGSVTGSAGGGAFGVLHNGTGTGTFTIASNIVDNGGTSFIKGGVGRVSLTGTNSYTGGTTISGGTLMINSVANGGDDSAIGASSADSANLVLEGGTLQYTGASAATDRGFTLIDGGPSRAIQVDGTANLAFGGVVVGSDGASLNKTGTGTLTLANAANTYTGTTTISGGTLSVGTLANGGMASGIGASSSDAANLVIQTGGTLQYTGGTVSTDRGFTLSGIAGGAIDVANAGTTLTVGGSIAGAVPFRKAGAGTLILSGINSNSGPTTIDAGILRAGSTQAFGGPNTMVLADVAGVALELNGFNNKVGGLSGGGSNGGIVRLGGATLTIGGSNVSFAGTITGAGGLTKENSSVQTLLGCSNNYTGATTISGGTLSVDCLANGGQASGIGASSGASANLVFAGGALAYTGGSINIDRGITLAGTGAVSVTNAATVLGIGGAIVGGGALRKEGAGTLVLSGNNTFTGGLTVNGGIVRAGSASAFGARAVTMANVAGATLDLANFNSTIAVLNGGGAAGGNVALGAGTLALNWGSGLAGFYGTIGGSGGLVKAGGFTQYLGGCGSSYTGSTVVSGGVLQVACLTDGGTSSAIGASGNAAGNLLLSGGTLQYVGAAGSTDRLFTLGASANSRLEASGTGAIAFTNTGAIAFATPGTNQTIALGGTNTGNNSLAAQITNNGAGVTSLTKDGLGTWILNNANSNYTGVTTIAGGVLGVDKLANGGLASSIGASSAAASNLIIGNGSTLRYTGAGDTTNRLFTLSAGVTFLESSGAGAIVFTDTGLVTLAGADQARTIALGGTNSGNNTLAGSIGNAGLGITTLAKNDSGTWVLTGNNSYTGPTNINGGTLFVGGGGTTGVIASAVVNNFGALGFNRSDLLAYGGQIVGTGSLRQAGTGTSVLTGTNTYTGGTTIDAGTLQLGNGGTTGSIVGDVVDNGVLAFDRSDIVTFSGVVSGSGAVRQIGGGTTVLSGINSYAGGTSFLGGILQVSADANLGNAAGGLTFAGGTLRTTASFASARNSSLTGAGTILTDAGTTLALNGLISGAGSLTKSGTGILTLSGNNSYAGATNVNAGTLRINGNQSAATGLVTVASGATLAGSGTIGGSVNVLDGGILAPGNSPGTFNINGDLSLAGGSVLNFEFGQADVAGGPLNDLVNVGGNLTLDGTINVNVSTGGNFGGGLYRVFNYGGVLIDTGLTLGSMPAGSNVTVQTSVAGQVNLINSDGLSLSFWDGTGGPKFNNVVNGGGGSWHLGGADNNWTGADGSINAAYAVGTFAIFAGAPGTVTVDNSGGAVTATGMQFATGGYVIDGSPLTLVGPDSIIRVGDGTAAGAGYVATINADLTGASRLVKTDAGTLVLNGTNGYTGGTAINGGMLQITSDANLGDVAGDVSFDGGTLQVIAPIVTNRDIDFTGSGTIDVSTTFNAGTTLTLAGDTSGAGALTKTGLGMLIVTGDAAHAGLTTVAQGGLRIGDGGTMGSIAGDIALAAGTAVSFDRSDSYSYGGSFSGSGNVAVDGGILTLTGNSNFLGNITAQPDSELRVTAGNTVATSSGTITAQGSVVSVSGAGSTLSGARVNAVVTSANGAAINVTNGGVVRTTIGGIAMQLRTLAGTGSADLNIAGAGSLVDLGGNGQLQVASTSAASHSVVTISDGGSLRTGILNTIGNLAGNTTASSITVTGAGSNWTSSGMLLLRNAQISVLNGGAARFASAQLGTIAQGANVLVSGAGSTFTTTGNLGVGTSTGNGALTIADGAVVTAGTGLTIATAVGTTGAVNIGGIEGGAAAIVGLINGNIIFGPGTGELNFNHTGTDHLFANSISGAGAINHAAGTTRLTGDSSAFTGITSVAGGTLLVDGILGDAASGISVAAGATLGGTGTIGGNVVILNGNLNPGDIGGIPGRLTIGGDLNLTPAATLNVDFGQANVVGGVFNDLIEVGGNLTLDGTLNVSVTSGGSFDPGVYRVINYGGALTDNGLTVDPGYFVQTSVAKQVNLVNTTGLTMRFWDGVNGAKNDGVITGGDGLWQNSGGNDNWTEYDGSANAPFTDDAFAVFSGVGGTVTVDASLGGITASGMQFASDGYGVTGAGVSLVTPEAVIRVGDGTAAGAGYAATIASALTGAGNLVKTDLGTLALTGASSFAGDVYVRAGGLRIADGGTLTSANGLVGPDAGNEAIVTVTGRSGSGDASTWTVGSDLTVGYGGSGTLDIADGGKVASNGGLVGLDSGGVGRVLVTGAGSSWDNTGRITIGLFGTGTLRIEDGATVTSNDGIVGGSAHGDVVVSGPGTSWTNAQQLNIGSFGAGTMRIENGASVTSNQGYIGANAAGSVTVTGAGSNWLVTDFSMTVGNDGTGALTIDDGGRVRAEGGFSLGVTGGSSATVTLLGTPGNRGTLETSQIGAGLGAASITMDGGLLRATQDEANFLVGFGARTIALGANGGVVDTDGYDIGISPRFTGAGGLIKEGLGTLRLAGANSYAGATLVNAGTLLVSGNQSAATGLTTVSAGATLGGTGIIGGNVDILGGATLAPGESAGTLTINGNLSLASGSTLAYEFGQAYVAGGALNDLVNVGGDLILDGTINVSVSAGGTFGPGIYRIFNYGGALTDNGLALGTMSGGAAGVSVQTAIAGQVNLVNTQGLTLSFWDGAAGPKHDGTLDGGDGVWRIAGGSNNWTDANGTINADYAQDSFAVFAGTPGTVTIDDVGGNVLASGLQFASNGYMVTGDALMLTGAQAIVQVGDGSTAGAGYTATIAAEVAGAAQLVKTDAGTLVLTGANSYAGGTRIEGGTLQIGSGGTTGSIVGDIVNNGALVVDRAGTYVLGGTISGTGSLIKRGSGLLELTGTNGYAGGTLIDSGTIRVSGDAALGAAAGVLSLQGGTLQAGASFTSTRGILLGSPDSNGIDTQGFDVTLGGVIGNGPNNGAGNFLDKRGTGTLTLTGANTYSNRTIIAGGTLALAGAGTIGAGNVIVGSGTVFDISQATTGARVIQLGGGGTIALGSKTLTLGFGNSFTDWAGSITDGGISGGTGGRVVIAAPNGAVRYFGATSYTGGTTVAAGSFELVGNGALHSQGAVTVNGGALFNIAGTTAAGTTIGDLSGAGSVFLGGKTLTFGTANDTALTGVISGNGGALVKQGAGVFTLGGANSYTGATDVLAGTLLVNGNQSAATGLTSVASGATLGGTGIIGGSVNIADGATLAPGAGGPGALTINGNLALASGATLGFEFGRANNPGGPLNDVVNVGGNLVLDGTLNVAVSPGGAFDIGLYRIANYGGSLTDNGLALGTMPAGANVQVQTAIAGEVNLVNRGSATLNFWDGGAGTNKFNNAVDGGSGMWRTALDNSWTETTGAVNAAYDNGAFAIFAGTGGVVTIDNSLGAVAASGLQFAATNYRIQGGALTLTGPQSVIRVGDGTGAGLGYSAIIASEITGSAQLVKTDLGRLELTGANSYTGGTAFNGGTVRISGDASLGAASGGLSFNGGTLNTTADLTSARAVDLAGQGVFSTDAGTTLTLTGNLAGAGLAGKLGAGTLVLAGTGSQTGGIEVVQGTLFVNGDYGAATGRVTMNQLTTLGGTGTIGGDVNLAGTLAPGAGGAGTLTINGDLTISQTATLAYEFGEAGVVGGALNDLVNVGGDLVLDGVLNVGVPAGGAFDVGVYRMFNYGGALTNNGLTLGAMPAGANAVVQTSIAGQVNLINSAGLTLNFWDGAGGPKNDGAVNGGNGVWQAGSGNDNWTGAEGAVNAGYADGAFAVFGGTGGTVTVDNGLGAVSVAGMQFAANNYVITGSGITLTDATATIRVGDGSAAGAGFTATINSALGGAAQLVKSDAGTLVLGGTNAYTGGTLIAGGTLRISGDANLGAASGDVTLAGGALETSASLTSARDVEIMSAGTIATATDTVFTYNGLLSGAGALTKNGAGTLLVTADNSSFGGSTTVAGGTLAVQGRLGGAVTLNAAGRLEGAGRVGSIVNAGVVAPGSGIGSLTAAGDYSGNGGVLEIEAELGGDASRADRLLVGGATSGNTRVTVINRGGPGAQTVEGIKIVDVTGASNGDFTLDGDYLFDGQQAVIAGAYGYRLYKNGIATPQDGDWYLRSARLDGAGNPEGPLYQPGVPVYEAYVGALQSLNRLPTLQQRIGNRSWAASPVAGAGLWGRFESERQRPEALVSTSDADRKVDQWHAQLGLDAVLAQRSDGAALVGGLTAHYGKVDSAVTSIFGDGTIDTQGYGVGATMTWYGPKGFYVDGQVKLSWFDSDLESSILGSLARGNKGDGQAFSLELGKQTSIGRNLSITPQVQMSYAKVDFDRFADPSDAAVSVAKGESLKTRWGLAIDHQTSWKGAAGDTRRTRLYTVMNFSYEWLDGAEADVSGTPIVNRDHRLSGELGLGGSYSWGDDRFTLYTEVSGDTTIADFGAGYNLKGTAGFRVRF
ncbi:MAG: autotransporter-associated beta strand repeat-containing protein [Sphingopyxis sp.]|nr:autotransporter-associated beta strand repeat-containing protein [Sphingopyxis sp.]